MSLGWSGLVFLLGLSVGSFLNSLVYRLNKKISPLFDRSFCPSCRHILTWYDLVPLISFAFQKGRCRYCHSPISWQYPLVELATGILTLFAIGYSLFALQNNLLITSYYLLITYALIVIFISDLRYQTIPDKVVYPTMGLAILFHLRGVSPPSAGPLHLGGVLLTGLATAGFFGALVLITQGKGMGMGDVKLAALMGLVLGFPKIVVALYLAFLTGAMVGVILVLTGKKRFGEHIPFGPFLTTATWISLFWGEKIVKILGY